MSAPVAVVAALALVLGAAAGPGDHTDDGTVTKFTADGTVTRFVADGTVTSLRTETEKAGTTTVTLGTDVLFAFGSATLPTRAQAAVDDVAAKIPAGAAVTVDGHTDSVGSDADNLKLSRARAQAVADRLRAKSPGLKLSVQGYGESRPVAPNTTAGRDDPDGRAKNRRVEIRYPG